VIPGDYPVGVQLLDGIGAGIFGVVSVLVVADLTKMTGFVVEAAGFDAGFVTLAAIAGGAALFFALAMPETR
jgi:hypothetical protein